jgi:hypothetical protein
VGQCVCKREREGGWEREREREKWGEGGSERGREKEIAEEGRRGGEKTRHTDTHRGAHSRHTTCFFKLNIYTYVHI